MTLMRIRELASCSEHRRAFIVLDEVAGSRCLTFYANADDAHRLAREMARGRAACHPIFDFIHAVLSVWHVTPVRVVLEDVDGDGVGGVVYLRQGEIELSIRCYPPDALTIALRADVPIYATADVLSRAESTASTSADGGETARWIERVRPRDFEA